MAWIGPWLLGGEEGGRKGGDRLLGGRRTGRGAFVPVVGVPNVVDIIFFRNGGGDGVLLLAVAVVAALLVAARSRAWSGPWLLVLAVACALGVGYELHSMIMSIRELNIGRGLVQIQWGGLVLVLAVLLLIASALMEFEDAAIGSPPSAADDTKPCPFCAETIKREAKVCRFCGRNLPLPAPSRFTDPNQPLPRELDGVRRIQRSQWLGVGLAAAALVAGIYYFTVVALVRVLPGQLDERYAVLTEIAKDDEARSAAQKICETGTKALPVQGQLDLFVDIAFDPVTERATLQHDEVVHIFRDGVIERVIPSCPESQSIGIDPGIEPFCTQAHKKILCTLLVLLDIRNEYARRIRRRLNGNRSLRARGIETPPRMPFLPAPMKLLDKALGPCIEQCQGVVAKLAVKQNAVVEYLGEMLPRLHDGRIFQCEGFRRFVEFQHMHQDPQVITAQTKTEKQEILAAEEIGQIGGKPRAFRDNGFQEFKLVVFRDCKRVGRIRRSVQLVDKRLLDRSQVPEHVSAITLEPVALDSRPLSELVEEMIERQIMPRGHEKTERQFGQASES